MAKQQQQPDKPKRGPGRPPTKQMPEPLNVDPEDVARSLFNGPPKEDWRYQAKKASDGNRE